MRPMLYIIAIATTFACFATPTDAQSNSWQVYPNCITPEQNYGRCVGRTQCPEVVKDFEQIDIRMSENHGFALQRSCNNLNINGEPLVCCTLPFNNPIPERLPIFEFPTHRPFGHPYLNFITMTTETPPPSPPPPPTTTTAAPSTTSSPVDPANNEQVPRTLPTVKEGCGNKTFNFKKIVGGEVSKIGAWPWIALLGYDDPSAQFKCGGTLISARHVLTAAHCVLVAFPPTFVRLGEHDLSRDTETRHIDIPIVKSVAHPDYNRRNSRSDLALVYLEYNVEFTELIAPICMPSSPGLRVKSYVDTNPFVVGWGKTQEGGQSATVLQELMITVLENEVCQSNYAKMKRLFTADQFDKAVICAGDVAGGKDTCRGDSGGPLMSVDDDEDDENQSRFYLIGVVSYGIGCARPEAPGVYTSTQYFMDWIIERVQETP